MLASADLLAMLPDTADYLTREAIARALAALAPKLPDTSRAEALAAAKLALARTGSPEEATAWAGAIAALLPEEPRAATAEIVEALKYPTATGAATDVLLAALATPWPEEFRTIAGRSLDQTVLDWLEAHLPEGHNLTDPPPCHRACNLLTPARTQADRTNSLTPEHVRHPGWRVHRERTHCHHSLGDLGSVGASTNHTMARRRDRLTGFSVGPSLSGQGRNEGPGQGRPEGRLAMSIDLFDRHALPRFATITAMLLCLPLARGGAARAGLSERAARLDDRLRPGRRQRHHGPDPDRHHQQARPVSRGHRRREPRGRQRRGGLGLSLQPGRQSLSHLHYQRQLHHHAAPGRHALGARRTSPRSRCSPPTTSCSWSTATPTSTASRSSSSRRRRSRPRSAASARSTSTSLCRPCSRRRRASSSSTCPSMRKASSPPRCCRTPSTRSSRTPGRSWA